MTNYKQIIGNYGETSACNFLEKNNYKIVDRNFRCKKGEIDIIAKDLKKNELVFIEVKTRSNLKFGTPAQAVNYIKQKHIYTASNYYIFVNKLYDSFIRFDVIEVLIQNKIPKINHLKQVI